MKLSSAGAYFLAALVVGCATNHPTPPAISVTCDPAIEVGEVDAKFVEISSSSSLQGTYLDYRAIPVSGGRVDDLPLESAIEKSGGADRLLSAMSPKRVPSTFQIIGGDTVVGVAATAVSMGVLAPAMLIPAADSALLERKKLEQAVVASPSGFDGHGYLFFSLAAYSALEVTASTCGPIGQPIPAERSNLLGQARQHAAYPCSAATTTAQCDW